jgi:hypothetical protein
MVSKCCGENKDGPLMALRYGGSAIFNEREGDVFAKSKGTTQRLSMAGLTKRHFPPNVHEMVYD